MVKCGICRKVEATYTCPRCGVEYCSLICYEGHGGQCQSGLAADLSRECLQGNKVDEESKRKFATRVKKIMTEDPNHVLTDERLESLVEKLIDGTLDIDDLSPEEQLQFQADLESGRLIGDDHWIPWWEESDEQQGGPSTDPSHVCCSSGTVSERTRVDICEISTIYALLMRHFLGDFDLISRLGRDIVTCLDETLLEPQRVPLLHMGQWVHKLFQNRNCHQFDSHDYVASLKDAEIILGSPARIFRVLKDFKKLVPDDKSFHRRLKFWASFLHYHVVETPCELSKQRPTICIKAMCQELSALIKLNSNTQILEVEAEDKLRLAR